MKRIILILFLVALGLFLLIIHGCNFTTGNDGLSAQDNPINSNNDPPQIGPPPGLSQNPPPIPIIKDAIASSDKIELSWSDDSPFEDGFIIKRDGEEVTHTDRNVSVWTDINISPEKTYCYAIIAYNKEWITSPSLEKCVTIPMPNNPPIISSVRASVFIIESGRQMGFHCQASDPDGDKLSYKWLINGVEMPHNPEYIFGPEMGWDVSGEAGNYIVQCDVNDGKGGSASGITEVIVVTPMKYWAPEVKCSAFFRDGVIFEGRFYVVWQSGSNSCEKDGPYRSYLSIFSENSADAVELSRTEISSLVISPLSIAINDDIIYIGGGDSSTGLLIALNLNDLMLKWKVNLFNLGSIFSRGSGIRDVIIINDNVFITGEVGISYEDPANAMVARFDLNGNFLWSDNWGGECYDFGRYIIPKNDGVDVHTEIGGCYPTPYQPDVVKHFSF